MRAVAGVSFTLGAGETLAIVGESGCGKTTTARMLLRLETPTSGSVLYEGVDLTRADRATLRRYRASVQAVFQDPWSSLNPRMRVADIVAEPLRLNQRLSRAELGERVGQSLEDVGLDRLATRRFPHEFSGGQRQRIAIARALALRPRVIVLDEPVSALDVSIRAQIMNLLKDLQERFGMSFLLIAHNLATVRFLAHRVAVMYLGQIIETAPSEQLFSRPRHPYTRALIEAARFVRPDVRGGVRASALAVEPAGAPNEGCPFRPRCPDAMSVCAQAPALREVEPGRRAACHFA